MGGLEIIKWVQSIHSPFLDRLDCTITNLHDVNFYVVAFPLLFWLYDKKFVRYLVSVFLLGFYWTNGVMKELVDSTRPPAELVRKLCTETAIGQAFPSGHSQGPIMFYGALALQFRKTWVWVAAALITVLIGLSRIYAGLHWPADVAGGWAIGALLLYGFHQTSSFWTGERQALWQRLLWAMAIPIGTALIWSTGHWDLPGLQAGDSWKITGAYVGFWVGSILEEEFVGFNPRAGGVMTQVAKAVTGLVVVFAVKEGIKFLLPDIALWDALRYAVTGMTATLLMPYLFQRFIARPSVGRSQGLPQNFS